MDIETTLDNGLSIIPAWYIVFWVIMFCAVIYLLIKFIPKLVKVFSNLRKHINNLESIADNVKKNTEDIKMISDTMKKDDVRISNLEAYQQHSYQYISDSLEERELIIRSLLGVVQGLQEIGADGPTKKAESEIQEYLVRKSHRKDNDIMIQQTQQQP